MKQQKFGKWLVIRRFPGTKSDERFLCKCECGVVRVVRKYDLLSLKSSSCGCSRQTTLSAKSNEGAVFPPSFGGIYYTYKRFAEKRGLDFLIDKKVFLEIVKSNCYYCGQEPSNIHKPKANKTEFIYNGVDRVDNDKGYVEGNVVPCCKICNKAKDVLNKEEFLSWIKRVYRYSIENKVDNIIKL